MSLVILNGRIGKIFELKELGEGKSVINFSLAEKGYNKDETIWHNITAFGKTAENINSNLQKGDYVAIEGRLSYSSKKIGDLEVKYTNIITNTIDFILVKKWMNKTENIEG